MKKKLKDLRISEKLSQKELAKKLGVSPSCIANWEKGLRYPQSKYILKYYSIFDLKSDFFSLSSDNGDFEKEKSLDLSLLNYKGVKKLYDFYAELIKNEEYLKKS